MRGLPPRPRRVRITSEAGTDLTYDCGDYPVMSQYGYRRQARAFRPLGRRPRPHISQRGQRQRQGGGSARATSSSCRIAAMSPIPCIARVRRRLHHHDQGRTRRRADARLARRLPRGRRRTTAIRSRSRIWAGASIRRRAGTGWRCTARRSGAGCARRPGCFPAISCSRPAPIARAAATAARAAVQRPDAQLHSDRSTTKSSSTRERSSTRRCEWRALRWPKRDQRISRLLLHFRKKPPVGLIEQRSDQAFAPVSGRKVPVLRPPVTDCLATPQSRRSRARR